MANAPRRPIAGSLALIACVPLSRALIKRALLFRFGRSVRALNSGDYAPLLAAYAENAVLHFHEGPHRWSGEHRGRAQIEHFLREFTRAGLRGEIGEVWMSGPPWALTLLARFDDRALDPDGRQIYANRTVLMLRTRRGRVVEQEDFYADTGAILELERRLRELGVAPAVSSGRGRASTR
jgi:ketosteroid isomerase-like protein